MLTSSFLEVAEENENQSREEARHGVGVLRWVWIAGAILVFYVLSVGPVSKLADKGMVRGRFLEVVYWPLIYVGDHFEVPHNFLAWYVHDLWKAM